MEVCVGCGKPLKDTDWVSTGWFRKRCYKCYKRIKTIGIGLFIIFLIANVVLTIIMMKGS